MSELSLAPIVSIDKADATPAGVIASTGGSPIPHRRLERIKIETWVPASAGHLKQMAVRGSNRRPPACTELAEASRS
jgi:hypothetical protein